MQTEGKLRHTEGRAYWASLAWGLWLNVPRVSDVGCARGSLTQGSWGGSDVRCAEGSLSQGFWESLM